MNDKKEKLPGQGNQFGVRLTERELEMVEYIKEQEGKSTKSAVIKNAIVFYYRKNFPAYVQNKLEKDRLIVAKQKFNAMSDQEKCEHMGAEWKDGMCKMKVGPSLVKSIPGSMVDQYLEEFLIENPE